MSDVEAPEAPPEQSTVSKEESQTDSVNMVNYNSRENGNSSGKAGKSHQLDSLERGGSEIERMAHLIERRRAERIVVTMRVRKRFLKYCLNVVKKNDHPPGKIPAGDIRAFQAVVEREVEAQEERSAVAKTFFKCTEALGFRNDTVTLLRVLNRALEVIGERDIKDDEYFFFQDFNFYFTVHESSLPWKRSALLWSLLIICFFYIATAVLFCEIMKTDGICPEGESNYEGPLAAVYFASTTMSTVGYGDLSIFGGSDEPTDGQVFVAILYMFAAMIVASTALSYGVETAASTNFVTRTQDYLFNLIVGEYKPGMLLYKHVRRVKFVKTGYIFFQFMALNLFGILVSRAFTPFEDGNTWNWMKSFYWSVQTTTTIGYGDIDQPLDIRWFQIFYLIFATMLVGNALGRLGNLKEELLDIRRQHAWKRREISKGMIEEMQAQEEDGRVDQYEFLVASLLTLGTIDSEDVIPIMDKFRKLAGKKGYIEIEDELDRDGDQEYTPTQSEQFEEEKLETELQSNNNFLSFLIKKPFEHDLCVDLHE